jgi:hypothetical protein
MSFIFNKPTKLILKTDYTQDVLNQKIIQEKKKHHKIAHYTFLISKQVKGLYNYIFNK